MQEPLDEQYLRWLYARIGSVNTRDNTRSYWVLMRKLYATEFVWLISNDDNRVEDGRELRLEFLAFKNRSERDIQAWLGLGCSVLEMLIALAHRLDWQTGDETRVWFWRLLDNLELGDQTDAMHSERYIDEVLNRLIWRTYDTDGRGGLFPLFDPHEDQTRVELWYQAAAYLLERM